MASPSNHDAAGGEIELPGSFRYRTLAWPYHYPGVGAGRSTAIHPVSPSAL